MNGLYPPAYYPLSGATFVPGQRIRLSIPVTSLCSDYVRTKVKALIYEGSFWSGHGTLLQEITSPEYNHPPGQLANYSFVYDVQTGSIDRRDVGVVVMYWDGSQWVEWSSVDFDDVYFVSLAAYDFDVGQPTVVAA